MTAADWQTIYTVLGNALVALLKVPTYSPEWRAVFTTLSRLATTARLERDAARG